MTSRFEKYRRADEASFLRREAASIRCALNDSGETIPWDQKLSWLGVAEAQERLAWALEMMPVDMHRMARLNAGQMAECTAEE